MPASNVLKMLEQVKKAVVFLGRPDDKEQPRFSATGCLLSFSGQVYLVTAKHVVLDPSNGSRRDSEMVVFYNDKNGVGCGRPLGIVKSVFQADWVFHPNPAVDLAVIPYGIDPETDDLKTIPPSFFASRKRLFQLYQTFQLSFQPGIPDEGKVVPVVRAGTISKLNDDGTLYIDGSSFPGNSGSPVFLSPSLSRFDDDASPPGYDTLSGNFVGIIGEYIPYQEVAISSQTLRPRVVFEENTGLSKVWTTEFINEVSESQKFKEQASKIKQLREKAAQTTKADAGTTQQ